MKKGGYQIVDLKNINHELNVGMTHPGVYDLIEGTRKPILLSGIQVDNKEYHDVFAQPIVNGSNIEFRTDTFDNAGYRITIQDNDVVTFYEV